MDKGKIEAMVTKFSEKFAIIMPKKHRKFVGVAWLIWMPHLFLKNRSDTYETPCILLPKLFWPTVRKNCPSDLENNYNSNWKELLEFKNIQEKFWGFVALTFDFPFNTHSVEIFEL